MQIPENFSNPHEELHRHFRNLCISFKKAIQSREDPEELQFAMEDFKDICKQMDWHHKPSGVYHKDAGDKATRKVINEFDRYISALQNDEDANPQDLLNALAEVERLIKTMQVT